MASDDRNRGRETVTYADPNYDENGYWGMRMRRGQDRAAYGWFRRDWNLETFGGYGGIHGPPEYFGGPKGDPAWELGGVSSPQRDIRVLRDFNATSPVFAGDGIAGNRLLPSGDQTPVRSWERRAGFEGDYSDRGVVDAGYSEGWARGPMPGAR